MFDRLNQQQQPYIQSGYGAMSRLNTLLGLGGGGGGSGGGAPASAAYRPTPSGGIDQRIPSPVSQGPSAQGMPQNMRLKQILALRAQNGDTEAARMLGQV
jgi:hypothetical protein